MHAADLVGQRSNPGHRIVTSPLRAHTNHGHSSQSFCSLNCAEISRRDCPTPDEKLGVFNMIDWSFSGVPQTCVFDNQESHSEFERKYSKQI